MPRLILALALFAAAGCSGQATRYATPAIETEARVPSRFDTVQVLEVQLPSYAASEEIFVQTPDGSLSSSGDTLWADDPSRAITLALTRALSEITGARTAPEPWPFASLPDARIDIQVEDLLVRADGTLLLSGQYFLASTGGMADDRAGTFRLTQKFDAAAGPNAIARARAEITAALALRIARDALG